ncbi:proton-conducting transporter membrane subunit [Herpetosiphon giganteus]|uniref:proton-conducting transporter transmembrane domain-containing protein n=1 Tax=Herpetosiphon giganteus TaxID=2029754 RepID=UPI0019567CD9|nr:proton-conducting transporter membrane subunit [Herpetosiphon giganteus]MBM7844845.1 formate hydrogenlyase subunit 3/multisubunit Na+/H+ antiporter MnhD subunit [Herpetosiphon giganteus]
MTFLLMFCLPLVMAVVCFALRQQQGLVQILAIGTTILLGWVIWQVPVDQPISIVGVSMTVRAINRLFLLAVAGSFCITFIVATRVAHGENFVVIGLIIFSLINAALTIDVQSPFLITLLLLATGLAIILAQVDLPIGTTTLLRGRAIGSGLRYLVMMLLAGVLLALCFVLADLENTPDRLSTTSLARPLLALLVVGISLRLAIIPFHSWLPDLLEDSPPLVGILIGMINLAALLFLVSAFQFLLAPGLLTLDPGRLRLVRFVALGSAIGGSLLAIHERPSLRRFLAMLLISDSGMMLFGVVSSTTGLTGALFQAFNQLVLSVVLWTAVALLERPEPTRAAAGDGWLRRRPWASGVFICGVLALLGIPPFNGFASRTLLYQGAAEEGRGYLVALLIATMLGAYAFALVLRDHFLGRAPAALPEEDLTDFRGLGLPPPPPQRTEPLGATTVAVALLGICLLIGLYPPLVLDPIIEAVRGLTFVQFL